MSDPTSSGIPVRDALPSMDVIVSTNQIMLWQGRRIIELERENAKLREAVSMISRCWDGGCPMASGAVDCHGPVACKLEVMLAEMGIEVNHDCR